MDFFCFPYLVISEQSALFGLYLNSWTTKNHEKILDKTSISFSERKNHLDSYFGYGDTKITRRCIYAVWNPEQFLVYPVFDQVNGRIWKRVL